MTLLYVNESSIDKALFAKISPRLITTLVAHSGNIRKVALSDFIESIEIEGIHPLNIIEVFNYSDLNLNGEYFWDRDNGVLYVYYTGTVPKKVVVIVSLFVTTTFDVLGPCDPDNGSNPNKTIWRNRLQETSFQQSVDDMVNGKLGISTTSITLINNDSFYNYLASNSYSLKNSAVKVWVIINEFSNRSLIFKGLCQDASWSGSNLALNIIEQTKLLQQDATYGDSTLYTVINKTTWPSSKDDDQGKYVPYIMSPCSAKTAKRTKGVFYSGFVTNYFAEFEFWDVDPTNDIRGIYVGNQSAGDYSAGKKYVLFRGTYMRNDHKTAKASSPTLIDYFLGSDILDYSITVSGTTYYTEWLIDVSSASTNKIYAMYPGMRIWFNNKTAGTYENYEMFVTRVDTLNNVIGIRRHVNMSSTTNIHSTPTDQFRIRYAGPTVYVMKDGIPVYLSPAHYWFDTSFSSNSSGFANAITYLIVTYDYNPGAKYTYYFNSTIQQWDLYTASFIGTSADDVPDLEYYVRFLTIGDFEQIPALDTGNILSITLNSIKGIRTDNARVESRGIAGGDTTSSFYDYKQNIGATSYQDVIVSNDGNNTAKTYVDVLEKILYSSFGFIVTNMNGQVIVRLFENEPFGSTLLELSEDDVKDGSISSDNDFSDFSAIVNGYNIYRTVEPQNETSDSDMKLLSGDVRYNFENYLNSAITYEDKVRARLEAYKFHSLKKYTFTIINKGYELTPGDRISIRFDNSGKWLGSDTTKSLFVIRVNKALSGVVVTCIENIFP